jgi:hypothetical protein
MEPLRSLEAGYYLGKGRARREVMGPKWLARFGRAKGQTIVVGYGHLYKNARLPQTCILLPYSNDQNY